jgi:hypothetical protein
VFLSSPVGRLLSFLFTLGIAAVLYFALIKDRVDNAKDSSSNGNPTETGGESLFKRANFTKALATVRGRIGGDAEMLKIQVLPGEAEFQVKRGQRADGYRYTARGGRLEKVRVEIVGGGTIEGLQYPFRVVAPGVTELLDNSVRERKGLHATTMTLEKGPAGTKLAWTINAEGNGRTGLVFSATPEGSGLKALGGSVPSARKQQECILKAGSDARKIQACVK